MQREAWEVFKPGKYLFDRIKSLSLYLEFVRLVRVFDDSGFVGICCTKSRCEGDISPRKGKVSPL
jgi:hypothetical protein